MASSDQLEREIRDVRGRLTEDLEELQRRITPGQLIDQMVDYGREGPVSEFVGSLGREIRQNPLPLLLTAAGITWLIIASSRSRSIGTRGTELARPIPGPTVPGPVSMPRHSWEAKTALPSE